MTLPGSLPIGPLASLSDVVQKARSLPTRIVVIAGAQDDVALEAAALAEESGLARCILVGDQHRIEAILWDLERDPKNFQVVNRQELHEAVAMAVELVREGQGHILMKGKVTTGDLLKGVEFRGGNRIETYSLVMRSKIGTVRFVEAVYRMDELGKISAIDY